MSAYHESRLKALSEYFALRYPYTPRIIKLGHSLDPGWEPETIDSVEVVEGQVIDSEGHFPRQIPHVNLLPGYPPAYDSEQVSFDDEKATPDIARQTQVDVAEIQHATTIGRSSQNPVVLRQRPDTPSPVSLKHIRFRCFEGIWAVEDLGSLSGTIVNGIYIQGRGGLSSSSRGSNKRSLSTSAQDLHPSFSASVPSFQGSDIASAGRNEQIPTRLTLRPNEINEVRIGGHRLIITPYMRPTSEFPFDDLAKEGLFPSPDSFWNCRHCERSATRVAVAKFAPVACELSACGKEDLEDFDVRAERLRPSGKDDTYLERILAIFRGNDGRETPSVASLFHMTAVSLEQKIAEKEAFELWHVKDMLEDLLTALALHDIDHGNISKSTIFVDDSGRVHLRGFMRPANLRRLGQDVQDLFDVFRSIKPCSADIKFRRYLFRSITLCCADFKFCRYLSETFNSVKHARMHFPSPDAAFEEDTWHRDVRVYEKVPEHAPALTYIAIGQLCDLLLLENPSEATSHLNKLRDLRRPGEIGAEFDHCILDDFQKAFPELKHRPLPQTSFGRVPVLNLSGYGSFLECSRLRLWASRQSVDVFDRIYAKYPFLDVVSDEGDLNGSYAAGKDVPEIVSCLNLPTNLFSSLPRQEEDVASIPRFLFYLQNVSVSLLESSDGKFSWSTGEVSELRKQPAEFAKLVQTKHEYPHIFKTIPRALLDEFKSILTHEPPSIPDVEEIPRFEFGNRKRRARPPY
ncbi:MAG: hypothetical protein Q9193_002128 [Seirophora villosa]